MMKFRNPRFNAFGGIDGEIDHPHLGWVPFTAAPDDPEPMGRELFAAAVAGEFGPVASYVPPPPAPEPVPPAITRRQLRLWLVRHGISLSAVEAAIDKLPEPQRTEARIEWEDASVYERDNPLLVRLAGEVLRVSDKALSEALDAAFREASTY